MEIKYLNNIVAGYFKRQHSSNGFDLVASVDKNIRIAPGETAWIPTGIAINMMSDVGYDSGKNWLPCALLLPRSGMGCLKNLVPGNSPGLIDADYQGEIVVCLTNRGSETAEIAPMDRIAQLIFISTIIPQLSYVDEFSCITSRGEGGFGSTGK